MTPTEQIKEKLDVVDFIKQYVELKPAGKNRKGICPFHQEKTPSFVVSPDRQIWRCFGCGEGGDIFRFLMRYENLEFYEALRVLAEKAGVDLKRGSSADQRQLTKLYETVNAAKDIYKEKLRGSNEAIEYLKSRALTGQTVADFEIGFAPDSMDSVTVELLNKGFRIEDIFKAGLAVKTQRGQNVDRFRNRIMFPIHNHFGKVVGFSGRIMPGSKKELAKYINTPETPIFNKSRVMYGYWKSKKPIRDANEALLVEGQMDFLQLWQNEIHNVAATSGTASTAQHLRALSRSARDLIVAFDKDDAGMKATERLIDMAGALDFNVSVLDLGEHDDPAEFAVADAKGLKEAIEKTKPAMEHYLDYYLTDEALGSLGLKKDAVRKILEKINFLSSGIDRSHWVRELSFKADVPEKELEGELELIRSGEPQVGEQDQSQEDVKERELSREELISERIMYILSQREDLLDQVKEHIEFMPDIYRRIYKALIGGEELDTRTRELMDFISMHPDFNTDMPGDAKATELKALLRELELEYLGSRKENLRKEVLLAERKGDDELMSKKLKEFDDITRKMQNIRHAKGG